MLEGKQVTRFQNKILYYCIFNRLKHPLLNSYFDNLVICHADLGGNNVGHNFDSTRRSVLLGPDTLPHGSASVPTAALFGVFYFIPSAKIKRSCNGKRNYVFPLIFIGPLVGFKDLI